MARLSAHTGKPQVRNSAVESLSPGSLSPTRRRPIKDKSIPSLRDGAFAVIVWVPRTLSRA